MGFVARVRVTINQANLNWFLSSPAGPIVSKVTTIMRRTANAAQATAPVRTGKGRASIQPRVIVTTGAVIGGVWMDQHMWYQERGTGPIRARRAKYLAFWVDGPGGRRFIRTKQVRGVTAKWFLTRAFETNCPWPVRRERGSSRP